MNEKKYSILRFCFLLGSFWLFNHVLCFIFFSFKELFYAVIRHRVRIESSVFVDWIFSSLKRIKLFSLFLITIPTVCIHTDWCLLSFFSSFITISLIQLFFSLLYFASTFAYLLCYDLCVFFCFISSTPLPFILLNFVWNSCTQ